MWYQIYNETNQQFRDAQQWDKVMYTAPKEFALKLAKASTGGWIPQHKSFLFFLTFGLGILGSLMFVLAELKLGGPAGIKNNGVYHSAATNEGVGIGISVFVFLVSFYLCSIIFHLRLPMLSVLLIR